MNGAESLVATLVNAGVEVCFANPGTSELHLVAALDRVPGMRCVLCLFEGGVTGAADGYARMAGKPAATLLHLGPGLGNGFANLHNARRAHTPVLNVVGEHATYHMAFDAPLTSDIQAVAGAVSAHVDTVREASALGAAGARALAAAQSGMGHVSTLIVHADAAWTEGGIVADPVAPTPPAAPEPERVRAAAEALRAGQAMILAGNLGARREALLLASAIAAKTGARLATIGRNPRLERGAGTAVAERLANPAGPQSKALADVRNLILVGEGEPITFFGHPNRPSRTTHPDCAMLHLADPHDDALAALRALADEVGARTADAVLEPYAPPELPTGPLNPDSVAAVVGALLPENAVVADESITVGRSLHKFTRSSAPHDWMHLPGGAIGIGIPLATGAAVAVPDRKVINLQADGSGMYTVQALWTQARENLDVLTVVWSNRSYKILRDELGNVGLPNPGPTALSMLDLSNPEIGWVGIARGFGVEAEQVDTLEGFIAAFRDGIAHRGPRLIEVVL
ncbi:acetolactate synthase large subunit [Acuticoccus mangrovi]|uniref:Acetolactate synthase large subunit n=1 Tax=Acuticoccus mangrovi TaxID=2796142 RepID=A0A934INE8_9HYPH|nr:acetolactate synthase large subunit [Acuticoccus mangrovi]MBJ3777077.1 acetolactate synthase large subunit [Acuticoccus mangrovi]